MDIQCNTHENNIILKTKTCNMMLKRHDEINTVFIRSVDAYCITENKHHLEARQGIALNFFPLHHVDNEDI